MVSTTRYSLLRSSSIFVVLAGVTGCADDFVSASDCIETTFDRQPTRRFVEADTYYLPTIKDSIACESLHWQLGAAPEGNSSEIIEGEDNIARFTPTITGDYRFELIGTSEQRSITVVDARPRPFHNLNYFGSRSAALVGSELWVADVYTPTVTRLDPTSLTVQGTVVTGSWPVALGWQPGMDHVVVAQRGNDTLGFIDIQSGRLTDAVWVGDEPSNVVVSSDGRIAWVALATEAAIAVVDTQTHAVLTRIKTVADPLAMALSPDGATLAVASHRSGQPTRASFSDDPVEEERDLAFIDTATDTVRRELLDLGSTFTGLTYSEDGSRLFVATQRNNTEISQVDPSGLSFQNMILVLDANSGAEWAAVDLAKQPSSGGFATFAHQLVAVAGSLWVAVESSDLLLELDPQTLAERRRVPAPGRPRALAANESAVWIHGAQGFSVTRWAGSEAMTAVVGEDPRPARVAAGLAQFTGAGEGLFADRTCNSCHTDGVGDTQVWKAGPFPSYYATRSQFWLQGTQPLGWDAYLSNTTNFAFGVSSNVGRRLTTEQNLNLAAYLNSVMPPPPANGWTLRDGTLTEQGQRGRTVYQEAGACASCHPLPLTTNQQLLERGITEGAADVPALVGAYRHGVWLKHGEARTLRDSVVQVAQSLGTSLTQQQVDDLTRYLQELTDRHFFVLASDPPFGATRVAPEAPLHLTFNVPVWDDPDNLKHIELHNDSGQSIFMERSVEGATVTLVPDAPLQPDTRYTIAIAPAFASLDERPLFATVEHPLTTAQEPSLRLEGQYAWTVQFPAFDFAAQGFDFGRLTPVTAQMTATPTPSGAMLSIDYGGGSIMEKPAIVEGDTLHLPNLIIAVGGSGVDSTTMQATLVDADRDGIADSSNGTLGFSGPGMREDGLSWTLGRPTNECEPGASGALEVTVVRDAQGHATIEWDGGEAIGLYVTDPGVALPSGPNAPITGGAVYWGLQSAAFPMGFLGPLRYGDVPAEAVDATEALGGDSPGPATLESGRCYQFTVTNSDLESGQFVLVWD